MIEKTFLLLGLDILVLGFCVHFLKLLLLFLQIVLFLNVEILRVELTFGSIVLVLFSTIMPCIHGLSYFILIFLLIK